MRYGNATRAKLKNRSVEVYGDLRESSMLIEFKLVDPDLSSRALHKVLKNKVVCTGLPLSNEAALGLFLCLGEELKKKGLIA